MTIGKVPSATTGPLSPAPALRNTPTVAVQPSAVRVQAETASKSGGMLPDHIVAVQELATKKQVCVMVRPVNADATSLIGLGFGTKDMAIKGKSSTLPPFSGMIPRDQKYGKAAFDKEKTSAERSEAVIKFNGYNEQSIKKETAKSIDLNVPKQHFEHMLSGNKDFVTHGTWMTTQPGESKSLVGSGGVMSSKGSDGQEFKFWGEKLSDGSVNVFELKTENGVDAKGDAVQVMANRQGKAVTADYDLAMVAPRMQDYGGEHTRPLKVTSFEEQARRVGIKPDDLKTQAPDAKQWDANQLHKAQIKWDRDNTTTVRNLDTGETEKLYKPFDFETFEPAPVPVGTMRMDVLKNQVEIAESATQERYDPDNVGSELKDFGNISQFTRKLLPDLNAACGLGDGLEVFHHSDDAGNPFSDATANYPLTVILPNNEALKNLDKVQIIRDGGELTTLSKTLKNAGFLPIATDRWDNAALPQEKRLTGVRSDAFLEARENLEAALANKHGVENKGAEAAHSRRADLVEARTADVEAKREGLKKESFAAKRDVFERSISPDQAQKRQDEARDLLKTAEQALWDAQAMRPI